MNAERIAELGRRSDSVLAAFGLSRYPYEGSDADMPRGKSALLMHAVMAGKSLMDEPFIPPTVAEVDAMRVKLHEDKMRQRAARREERRLARLAKAALVNA